MTATLPPDVWVPVSLRWRHVIAGDVFVGSNGLTWHVTEVEPQNGGCIDITCQSGKDQFTSDVDPDDVISVLVPALERDAVELTRDQLGARLVERRME